MKTFAKIGLALGAGASRGLAHIGVLQVLEEYNIRPHYIAGSSIGAVVGALYAAGISPKVMEAIAKNFDSKHYYDMTVPKYGFIQGKKIEGLIQLLTQNKTFNELNIPLAITATDLIKCKLVVITEGKVHKAVRASISIPGIFVPVMDGDKVLVDGGVLERVPVKVVKEMGADVVLGVDVGFRGEHRKAANILDVFLQSLEVMELSILSTHIPHGDIMIYPELNNINPMVFEQADECIQEGRRAALKVIDQIQKLIL